MTISRRNLLSGAALLGGTALLRRATAQEIPPIPAPGALPPKAVGYTPVVTPDVPTLPWTVAKDGAKEFHLVAEPVKREFAKGMIVDTWGYNGSSPGPTIEVVEGDHVRIFVTNKLPERTSVHWHAVLLPNGMDGVAGLNQPHIQVGETYVYEWKVRGNGVKMYHPHSDEMVQMAMGMMGFFVIHPKTPKVKVDRHFCILVHEWAIAPGTSKPNPAVMTDFNIFTFNGRVWPGTAPLVVKEGDRVRISLGNLSMDNHPIHLHGYAFELVGTDGGEVPKSARWPETTVDVVVGSTRTVELVADAPGDWAFHCHKSHHTMNAMGHDVPNMLGVNQKGVADKVQKVLPSYMPMGENGMGDMMMMGTPKNTLPMMSGKGPFGDIEMGGMFTVFKVRAGLASYDDPGWYVNPEGTQAKKVKSAKK